MPDTKTHLIYIDDSRDEHLCIFSAIAIPVEQWRQCLQNLQEFRRDLKTRYGIFVHKEFHAWKFVSGRGQISDRIVTKYERSCIFREALEVLRRFPEVKIFNACFPSKEDVRAFEWLINRIERTLKEWQSYGILIPDEGKDYTRLIRKMRVFNPIPSRYGYWLDDKAKYRNIPIERIVEDPIYKPSQKSYFIQMADFVAYALLRRERPLASKTKYHIDSAFTLLNPVLVREANRQDPNGIIRPK